MKKLLFPFLILSLMIASCVSKMERLANKQVEKTLKEFCVDAESFKILEKDIKICNDSLCIIHVQFSGNNYYGARVTSSIEYIFIKDTYEDGKIVYRESTRDLSNTKSIIIEAKEEFENPEYSILSKIHHSSKDSSDISYLQLKCSLYSIMNGREVEIE